MIQEDEQHPDHKDRGLVGHTKVHELYSVVHGEPLKDLSINYKQDHSQTYINPLSDNIRIRENMLPLFFIITQVLSLQLVQINEVLLRVFIAKQLYIGLFLNQFLFAVNTLMNPRM